MTVHWVYVRGHPVDSTQAITREVVERLRDRFDIMLHSPNAMTTIVPGPGDILIGHPNRYGDCTFRRSFAQQGWARRIVFAPFSCGMLKDAALIDDLVVEADLYLVLTGPHWWDAIDDSPFSHWRYKMLPFELGLNRAHFPQIRSRFSAPGQRRFLYIGNADRMKGGDYLAALADANPHLHIGWIRTGDSRHCLDTVEERDTDAIRRTMRASRLHEHPIVDWRALDGLRIIGKYDFYINCGRSDAMPCEALEIASWGLVPVMTPQSGYRANDWMTHVPLDDIAGASAILDDLNHWPDATIRARQAAGWEQLDTRYTWDRAAGQVRVALEGPVPAAPDDPAFRARMERNRRFLRRFVRREQFAERMHHGLKAARGGVRGAIKGLLRAA